MGSFNTIENIKARKIFDGRGNDAIEVDVVTKGGFGRFSSPSGASTGKWEVQAYPVGGVNEAVKIVNEPSNCSTCSSSLFINVFKIADRYILLV